MKNAIKCSPRILDNLNLKNIPFLLEIDSSLLILGETPLNKSAFIHNMYATASRTFRSTSSEPLDAEEAVAR